MCEYKGLATAPARFIFREPEREVMKAWVGGHVKPFKLPVVIGFTGLLIVAGVAVYVGAIPVATGVVGVLGARLGDLLSD